MQLKTVEELTNQIYRATVMTMTDKIDVQSIITQDRADIRAVLREGVEEIKEFMAVASSPEFEMGYQMAIKDYEERVLTLINTLLPGDTLSKVKADWDTQAENLMNGLPGDVSN